MQQHTRALMAALVFALATGPAARAADRALEPVELTRIAAPGLGSMSFPDWTPDGHHVVFGFTDAEHTGQQLGLIKDDGSGFSCLSCGLTQIYGADRPLNLLKSLSLDKPYVFSDGRRVLTRIIGDREDKGGTTPLSGPTQDFNFAILECAPSILQCRDRRLVPLQLPGGGLTRGVQNREARVAPDSEHLAWTEVQFDGTRMSLGRLVRASDHYELADVRVLNPAFALAPPDPTGFRLGGPLYELKNFAPDGRTLTYASFASAENYDVWELDLATGARRRITHDLEWNEGTTKSPDGASFINFSSRTLGRMAPFAQLPRPTFVDFPVYTLIGRFSLNDGNRKCLLRPWLLSSDGEGDDGYFGQPIDTDYAGNFTPHGNGPFSPDGTEAVFWEFDDAAAGTPEQPDSHLVVARFPARKPVAYRPPASIPFPTWGVPRDQWHGYQATQGIYTVDGPGGGTATITLRGIVNTQLYAVTYDGWSEDGRTFLDGTESSDNPFTTAYGHWKADLRLRGEHNGSLVADVTVQRGGAGSGTITSELDGRRWEGLPSSTCARLPTPDLRIEVLSTEPAGDAQRVTIRVTSQVAGDQVARPVRGVDVRADSAHATTNGDGIATITVPAGEAIEARAGGFDPAAVTP